MTNRIAKQLRFDSNSAPPSRESNPFATCWTQPGALSFVDYQEAKIDTIISKLYTVKVGQLVGPHGSGKTSLMHAIEARARQHGKTTQRINLADCRSVEITIHANLVSIDGMESVPRHVRWALLRKTRRAGALAVVASHHAWVAWPKPLALLARLSPTPMLMAQLFFQLTEKRPTPVQLAEALQAFDCHSGDLRSIWLDLYQLHEQRTRPGRTKKLSVSYSSL